MKCYQVDLMFNPDVTDDYGVVDDFVCKNKIYKTNTHGVDYLIPVEEFDTILEKYKETDEIYSPDLEECINSDEDVNEVLNTKILFDLETELCQIKRVLNRTENIRNNIACYVYIILDENDNVRIKSRTFDRSDVGINQFHPNVDQIFILEHRIFNQANIKEIKEILYDYLTMSSNEFYRAYPEY
ncbi:MAG: hypothetical protein ACOCQD_05500 [archaeon]